MKLPLSLAVVSIAVCCGGGPSEPVPPPVTPPASTPPVTTPVSTPPVAAPASGPLVFVATADHVCDIVLLDLGAGVERALGAFSDCPERLTIPGAPGYVMDERGVRWPLADSATVGDGKVIEPPPLPELADLEHPDSVSVRFELGRDGVVRAHRSWGTGEARFEEGVSYAGTGNDTWSLVDGAWVAGGEVGPGPATVTLGDGGVGMEELAANAAAVLAGQVGGREVCGWQVTQATPPVAWPLECGDAGGNAGPLFVQKDGAWVRLPGTDTLAGFDADQSGRWLILRLPGGASAGELIDLDTLKQVRRGARMWFWTASWTPTGRGSKPAR